MMSSETLKLQKRANASSKRAPTSETYIKVNGEVVRQLVPLKDKLTQQTI